jgi:hypothetical protein
LVTKQTLNDVVKSELDGQKDRLAESSEFLQRAEDTKAANDLINQQADYEELKEAKDAVKTKLDAWYAREEEGEELTEEQLETVS